MMIKEYNYKTASELADPTKNHQFNRANSEERKWKWKARLIHFLSIYTSFEGFVVCI